MIAGGRELRLLLPLWRSGPPGEGSPTKGAWGPPSAQGHSQRFLPPEGHHCALRTIHLCAPRGLGPFAPRSPFPNPKASFVSPSFLTSPPGNTQTHLTSCPLSLSLVLPGMWPCLSLHQALPS